MSNAAIDVDPVRSGRVRLQLAASMLAMAALVTQLPGPATAVAVLSGARGSLTAADGSGLAALNDAALVVASAVIWLLFGWGCGVLGLAALARIPGALGRFGRAALGRIAPAAVRRVVIAGLGVSVLTGAAACGVEQSTGAIQQAAHRPASSVVVLSDTALGALPHAAELGRQAAVMGAGRVADVVENAAPGIAGPVTAERGVLSPATAGPGVAQHAGRGRRGDSVNVDWPVHRPTTAPRTATPVDLDWPTTSPPGIAASRQHDQASEKIVIVRPGDSLWLIASTDLGLGADDASIDAAWRQWYRTNRSVIGADPNLIEPGQQLRAPHQAAGGNQRPNNHQIDTDTDTT